MSIGRLNPAVVEMRSNRRQIMTENGSLERPLPNQSRHLLEKKHPAEAGCVRAYEQHLMRRYNNLLFPKDRRQVSQADIKLARKRDLNDYRKLNDRLINLVNRISALPSNVDSETINSVRESIDDLIQDTMGVGGKAYAITTKMKELRVTLISSWSKGASGNMELQQALLTAENYYHQFAAQFEIPFIAQMGRKDSPIPTDEVVPALFMEKPDTIAMVMSWVEPSERLETQRGALQVLNAALDEGAQIDNVQEIRKALGVNVN